MTEPEIDGESLPDAGVGIHHDDGRLTLIDLEGTVLGTVDATTLPVDTQGVSIGLGSPPQLAPRVEVAAEVPPGCATASADGGVRVALCGEAGLPRRVEQIDADGRSTEMIGAPPARPSASTKARWSTGS